MSCAACLTDACGQMALVCPVLWANWFLPWYCRGFNCFRRVSYAVYWGRAANGVDIVLGEGWGIVV